MRKDSNKSKLIVYLVLLMSAPELKRGEYKSNNSTITIASDVRLSAIERGDWGTSFTIIACKARSF